MDAVITPDVALAYSKGGPPAYRLFQITDTEPPGVAISDISFETFCMWARQVSGDPIPNLTDDDISKRLLTAWKEDRLARLRQISLDETEDADLRREAADLVREMER
jgi:hypothetical protein